MGTSVETKKKQKADFPKFLMSVAGERSFRTMNEAGVSLRSKFFHVEIVGLVREANGSVRDITLAERDEMRAIADQCDAEK